MKNWLSKWGFLLPLPFIIILLCGLTSVSETLWSDELRISGSVETGSAGCTLTIGYWHNHPQKWPVEELSLGGVTYTKREARRILNTRPRGDATYILAQQLIGARLNIANGASPTQIAETITASDAFLTVHPLGSDPGNPAHDEGTALADLLAAYNEGQLWPPHCDFESPCEEIEYETLTEEPSETQEQVVVPVEEPIETQEPTVAPTEAPDEIPTEAPTEQSTQETAVTEAPTAEPMATQEPAG